MPIESETETEIKPNSTESGDSQSKEGGTTLVSEGKADSLSGLSLSNAIDKIQKDRSTPKGEPEDKGKKPADTEKKKPDQEPEAKAAADTPPAKEAKLDALKVKDPIKDKAPAPKVKDKEDASEEEIEEELKTPHKNEKSARRFRTLYNRWKEADGKAAKTEEQVKLKEEKLTALEKEMAELKAGKGATDEAIKKERDELQQYRRRYDLEKDPVIKERFDDRIKKADEDITSILENNGVAKEVIAKINSKGGFEAYMRENGRGAKEFLEAIPFGDAEQIRIALSEKAMIGRARSEHIRIEVSKANDYFTQKQKDEEEARKAAPNPQREEAETSEVLSKWTKNTFEVLPYFHIKEVPAGATAEEKKTIKAENAQATELRGLLEKALKPQDLQERVDMALAATLARRLTIQVSERDQRIADLEAELAELKEADETVGKGERISTGGSGKGNAEARKKEIHSKGFGAVLDAIESGEDVV